MKPDDNNDTYNYENDRVIWSSEWVYSSERLLSEVAKDVSTTLIEFFSRSLILTTVLPKNFLIFCGWSRLTLCSNNLLNENDKGKEKDNGNNNISDNKSKFIVIWGFKRNRRT